MNKLITLMLLALMSLAVSAQTGAPVDVNGYPTSVSQPTKVFYYDASSNLIFACIARSAAPNTQNPGYNFSLSVTGTGLTSIVAATNVGTVTTAAAHGLLLGNKVTVAGSTTSALNAVYYVQTVPSTTTFTITTAGVADATYNNGPLTISGQTPLLTGGIWSIEKLTYNGSNQLVAIQWANGNPGNYSSICANRAVTTGSTKITYQ